MESARRYCSLLEKLSPPSVGGFNAKASGHRGAGSAFSASIKVHFHLAKTQAFKKTLAAEQQAA